MPSLRLHLARGSLAIGLGLLLVVVLLLRLSVVTDRFYHALVKDPERVAPPGDGVLSPADGTVLYVRRIEADRAVEVVKKGVPIPLEELIKSPLHAPIDRGWLVGIYMNTESVHVNRVPVDGTFARQIVFNGPHLSMMEMDRRVILSQLVPGLVTVQKVLGLDPFDVENSGEYVLKSARETSVFRDRSGSPVYVIRIADYWVGKILTWIEVGQQVSRGQRLGMITWGSQVDICFAESDGMMVRVTQGEYVRAGETVLAERR